MTYAIYLPMDQEKIYMRACAFVQECKKEEKRGRNKGSIMLAMGKSVWGIHRFYLYYSYSCNFSVGLKLFQNKEFIKIVRDE